MPKISSICSFLFSMSLGTVRVRDAGHFKIYLNWKSITPSNWIRELMKKMKSLFSPRWKQVETSPSLIGTQREPVVPLQIILVSSCSGNWFSNYMLDLVYGWSDQACLPWNTISYFSTDPTKIIFANISALFRCVICFCSMKASQSVPLIFMSLK